MMAILFLSLLASPLHSILMATVDSGQTLSTQSLFSTLSCFITTFHSLSDVRETNTLHICSETSETAVESSLVKCSKTAEFFSRKQAKVKKEPSLLNAWQQISERHGKTDPKNAGHLSNFSDSCFSGRI